MISFVTLVTTAELGEYGLSHKRSKALFFFLKKLWLATTLNNE